MKVRCDGSENAMQTQGRTFSAPVVADGWVYFLDLVGPVPVQSGKVMRMKTDGTSLAQIGDAVGRNKWPYMASPPFVADDGWVWYQGQDDAVMKIDRDGVKATKLDHTCRSSPIVVDGWVFFQGTDDYLWRMKPDGSGAHIVGVSSQTRDRPFVVDVERNVSVFYPGMDQQIYRVLSNI